MMPLPLTTLVCRDLTVSGGQKPVHVGFAGVEHFLPSYHP